MNKIIEDKVVPSKQQQDVNQAFVKTTCHIGIEATAGSGKTTTLLGLLNFTSPFRDTVFLSFSNAIVNELKERVPDRIKASTLNSLGAGILYANYGRLPLVEDKYFKKALAVLKPEPGKSKKDKEHYKRCFQVQDICTQIRINLCELEYDAVEEMCDFYDVSYTDAAIKTAISLIKQDTLTEIDWTDQIYQAAINPQLIRKKFDFVFLDEAQDCNKAQIRLVENILKQNGRLVFCGDSKQCIYSFMGSDLDTFTYLKNRPNTINLPLSTSFRCSQAVIELAQRVFPGEHYIEAAPNAPKGTVRTGSIHEVQSGDMIVCRTNKPLFMVYFDLIDRGIKAHFIGKDIEKGIVDLAEKCMAPIKSRFEENLNKQLINVEKELKAKGITNPENTSKWISLQEKIELLTIVMEKVQTIKDLIPTIHEIFTPHKQGVRLLTGHRSKGLENERVFWINKFDNKILCPSPRALSEKEKVAELNVMFVMITRAKRDLFFLNL